VKRISLADSGKISQTAKVKGILLNIQRYNTHDGPGIRTLVFMKGCPLRCLWCDNPESQEKYPEVGFAEKNCIKCGRCLEACSVGAIVESEKGKEINREVCNKCGKCIEVCPVGALKFLGKEMSVEEVIKEVEKDILFYLNSGGGVTISGGEPTMQSEFVEALLKECHKKGIHSAIETCGYARWEDFEKVLRYTDLVLYDLKQMDPVKHKQFTGVSNELILENAKKIAAKGISMIIRVPLVPGYTDSEKNIEAVGEFVKGLGAVEEICLLPYHRLGESKYKKLGRQYKLQGLLPLDESYLQKLEGLVKSMGLRVQIGG